MKISVLSKRIGFFQAFFSVAFITLEGNGSRAVQINYTVQKFKIFIFIYFHDAFNFTSRWNDTITLLSTPISTRESANAYPTEETKLMFLRNILKRPRLIHDSSEVEGDALTLPGEINTALIGSSVARTWFPDDSFLTKGNECVARFSWRLWARNAWRIPKSVCVEG